VKRERWGSPLAQEKYQAEKACDKRHPYRTIIIIIIVVVIIAIGLSPSGSSCFTCIQNMKLCAGGLQQIAIA